jgi:hypothetical protein
LSTITSWWFNGPGSRTRVVAVLSPVHPERLSDDGEEKVI